MEKNNNISKGNLSTDKKINLGQRKALKNPVCASQKVENKKITNKKVISKKQNAKHMEIKEECEHNVTTGIKDFKNKNNVSGKSLNNQVRKKKSISKKASPKQEKALKMDEDSSGAKKIYNCKYCEFTTPYLSSYKIHTDIHEGVKYECRGCLHKAASRGALLNHMRTHPLCKPHLDPKKREKKSRMPPKKHKCDKCAYEAQTKKCLSDHSLLHLPKDQLPQFACNFCSFVAIRKNNLNRHKRLLHSVDIGMKMETLYCYHCDYTTIYKTNLIDHIKRHFKERKIYACEYCDLTFIYKMAYLQHEQTHLTKGLRFECPEDGCKYWVPKKYLLKKHMIKHKSEHQVRMYQCPNCSHRTKYRASFRKHLEKMCDIAWEQWKKEYESEKAKVKKEMKNETCEPTTEEIDSARLSESETEWEFSLSDQEI